MNYKIIATFLFFVICIYLILLTTSSMIENEQFDYLNVFGDLTPDGSWISISSQEHAGNSSGISENIRSRTETEHLQRKNLDSSAGPNMDTRISYHRQHLLQYSTPTRSGVNELGKPFRSDLRRYIEIPDTFLDMAAYDVTNFTFVTAVSGNHFAESFAGLGNIHSLFPEHKIVYYDLGLSAGQAKKVQTLCNVIYRKFDFSKYPTHVRQLRNYAFKAILYYETLCEHGAIFWVDASARMQPVDWTPAYDVARGSGVVQFKFTGGLTYRITSPGMYTYLPTDLEMMKTHKTYAAGVMMLYRTELVYWEVVHWAFLCALTSECIMPKGHRLICPRMKLDKPYCHRYDMSALAILLGNTFGYNTTEYVPTVNSSDPLITVQRRGKLITAPRVCVV